MHRTIAIGCLLCAVAFAVAYLVENIRLTLVILAFTLAMLAAIHYA